MLRSCFAGYGSSDWDELGTVSHTLPSQIIVSSVWLFLRGHFWFSSVSIIYSFPFLGQWEIGMHHFGGSFFTILKKMKFLFVWMLRLKLFPQVSLSHTIHGTWWYIQPYFIRLISMSSPGGGPRDGLVLRVPGPLSWNKTPRNSWMTRCLGDGAQVFFGWLGDPRKVMKW